MQDFENLFSEDFVHNISDIVEKKMPLLKNIIAFSQKDKKLALKTEEFENSLSKESKEHFHDVMRLTLQVEEYYFALAYFLGMKHSKDIA